MRILGFEIVKHTSERLHIPEGGLVERMVLDVDGNDVQIIRYNGNPQSMCVMVNDSLSNILPADEIDAFILERLK